MLNSYATQVIRTGTSYAVGWVVTFLLVHFAITVPSDARNWLTSLLVFLIGTVYYMVLAWLEKIYPPLGLLLGKPARPVYATTTADGAHVITALVDPHVELTDRQRGELAAAVTDPLPAQHAAEHAAAPV